MKQQMIAMLEMQDAMNSRVNENWRQRNHEWYRAIWVECAELMDHYGWKWWKHQSPDREQVLLELVDIWHFGLSLELMSGSSLDAVVERVVAGLGFEQEVGDFRHEIERFAASTLAAQQQFDVKGFARLMRASGLKFDDLYRRYVGKNVLNLFRQDHGYKDGSYRKVWGEREDNEHLVELVNALDVQKEGFKEAVYQGLSQRYVASA